MGIDQLREDNELATVRRELDRLVANRAMTGLTAGQREELGRAVRTLIDSDCGGVIEKTEEAVLIVARKLDR